MDPALQDYYNRLMFPDNPNPSSSFSSFMQGGNTLRSSLPSYINKSLVNPAVSSDFYSVGPQPSPPMTPAPIFSPKPALPPPPQPDTRFNPLNISSTTSESPPHPMSVQPMSVSQIHPLIQKYFPQSQWVNAQRVMMGESGGNAMAVGDNYPIRGQLIPSYGLFQIRGLPGRPAPSVLLNPEENVKYAAQMQATQGWGPWTVARNLGIV